jgi:flagellar FliL protein
MATNATTPNENAASAPQKSGGVLVPILCSLMASLLVGGGVIFFLMHSGKLGGAPAQVIIVAPKAEPTEPVTMDPFLVNLADAGGHSYLRATMVLEMTVPASRDKKAEKKPEGKSDADPAATSERAAMRDSILTVLGSQTSDALLVAGGKEQVKKTLIEQLNKTAADASAGTAMPARKVKDIYFTEFLVQR